MFVAPRALRFAVLLLAAGCAPVSNTLSDLGHAAPDEWAEMVQAVNRLRASGRVCGATAYGPAPPLAWNARLARAAEQHSADMASNRHFAHTGTDGSTPGVRASRAGYDWRRVGENIARNQRSVAQVVQAWAESPGHCENLMNPSFVEIGAAERGLYWTQVLGRPR